MKYFGIKLENNGLEAISLARFISFQKDTSQFVYRNECETSRRPTATDSSQGSALVEFLFPSYLMIFGCH